MKTREFMKEGLNIGLDAHKMHQEHEIQLARKNCYEAAEHAIMLHKLLGDCLECGVEPWAIEKLALAADYLKSVQEHMTSQQELKMPALPGGPGVSVQPPKSAPPAPTPMAETKKKNKSLAEDGEKSAVWAALKNWKVWDVVIKNNYYNGKYADYSPRRYPVVAGSAEEAKKVVLANADAILQDLLSKKLHSGKRVLPRQSAMPITDKSIGQISDRGGRSTSQPVKIFTPQGPMMLELSDGRISGGEGMPTEDASGGACSAGAIASGPSTMNKVLKRNG